MPDTTSPDRIRWASKVQKHKIARLYESEASGLLADQLADEVGIELLLRVESILHAMHQRVLCPRCHTAFDADEGGLRCPMPRCGFRASYADYRQSKRHRDLNVANALPAFETYARAYPRARSARDKMRLIDRLIHEFHWDAKFNRPNRSVGNNLIEGSHQSVVAFLDELSSVEGIDKKAWRKTIDQMWDRRRGK